MTLPYNTWFPNSSTNQNLSSLCIKKPQGENNIRPAVGLFVRFENDAVIVVIEDRR